VLTHGVITWCDVMRMVSR